MRSSRDRKLIVYIGTHRVVALLAEVYEGQPRLLQAVEKRHPSGFQNGDVSELEEAVGSLEALIQGLEVGEELWELPCYGLWSHPKLKMTRFTSSLDYPLSSRRITTREVRHIIEQTRKVAPLSLEDWVLKVIPESFWVNDLKGVQDPVGLEAQRLAVTLQIFTAPYASFRNLARVFELLELKVKAILPKTLALPPGLLQASEEAGEVIVLDFSGGLTHLILVREGKLAEVKTLARGGQALTQPIIQNWHLSLEEAERLKEQFGSLELETPFAEEIIPLSESKGKDYRQIKRSDFLQVLSEAGNALLMELGQEVEDFLIKNQAQPHSLILTGGGAKLEGALDLFSRRFPFPVRSGTPRPCEGAGDRSTDPAWAAIFGFIRWGEEWEEKPLSSALSRNGVGRTLLQFKDWLLAYF